MSQLSPGYKALHKYGNAQDLSKIPKYELMSRDFFDDAITFQDRHISSL